MRALEGGVSGQVLLFLCSSVFRDSPTGKVCVLEIPSQSLYVTCLQCPEEGNKKPESPCSGLVVVPLPPGQWRPLHLTMSLDIAYSQRISTALNSLWLWPTVWANPQISLWAPGPPGTLRHQPIYDSSLQQKEFLSPGPQLGLGNKQSMALT